MEDLSRTRILFVLHGIHRDPETYLPPWLPFASSHGYAVLAPRFSRTDFPASSSYNQGNLFTRDGRLRPRESWAFQVVEDLFDAARSWIGSTVPRYDLHGHSAGAQFVHRMLLVCPDVRTSVAIAANAGWYTLPTFELDYPYGLGRLPLSEHQARRALGSRLFVLLGELDTDPTDHFLRRTEQAMQQGVNRFERGITFHRTGCAAAAAWDALFGWRAQTVPGIGHDHQAMVAPASSILARYDS